MWNETVFPLLVCWETTGRVLHIWSLTARLTGRVGNESRSLRIPEQRIAIAQRIKASPWGYQVITPEFATDEVVGTLRQYHRIRAEVGFPGYVAHKAYARSRVRNSTHSSVHPLACCRMRRGSQTPRVPGLGVITSSACRLKGQTIAAKSGKERNAGRYSSVQKPPAQICPPVRVRPLPFEVDRQERWLMATCGV